MDSRLTSPWTAFPLGYEIFSGNIHARLEARHGTMGRGWITDLVMASAENLAWLRETGRRYITAATKSEKKFANALSHCGAFHRPSGFCGRTDEGHLLDIRTSSARGGPEVLDALRWAVVLANEYGTIRHANHATEHMLDKRGPLLSPQAWK